MASSALRSLLTPKSTAVAPDCAAALRMSMIMPKPMLLMNCTLERSITMTFMALPADFTTGSMSAFMIGASR